MKYITITTICILAIGCGFGGILCLADPEGRCTKEGLWMLAVSVLVFVGSIIIGMLI